jgi:hypothetical protein
MRSAIAPVACAIIFVAMENETPFPACQVPLNSWKPHALEAAYTAADMWLEWLKESAPISSDNSPNKKPLMKWFVSECAKLWMEMTDHLPAKSEYDIFLQLLTAAWKDLGLSKYENRPRYSGTKDNRRFRDYLDRSVNLIHDFF